MANKAMVSNTFTITGPFTEEMALAGERLLRRLDESGLQVRAALWLYVPDIHRWRFVVATPYVRLDGPRKVYRKLQAIIKKLTALRGVIEFETVVAVDPSEGMIQVLHSAVHTGPGIHGIRFSRNTIGGTFIEDAYIYRLN